ncbi:hypothetical protein FB567DRAFT_538553 [Paraphoma chrysanthemicola]|uniref:Uncharacterized protein n=1 Tax=Paraphoma chrysanthemicola TaxID=798071 RepID=A0A8K0QVR4_9PLEO|nr:hypothetical protein FB567DRAFT_538553 [Paraphoma chrysanthemicola]
MPIGFFWYGASTGRNHRYELDEFADFSASAKATSRVVSYLSAFILPIFAPTLYEEMVKWIWKQYLDSRCALMGMPHISGLVVASKGRSGTRRTRTGRKTR